MEVPPPKPLPRWMWSPEYQQTREEPLTPNSLTAQNGSTTPITAHLPPNVYSQESYGPMYSVGSDIDIDSSMYGQ